MSERSRQQTRGSILGPPGRSPEPGGERGTLRFSGTHKKVMFHGILPHPTPEGSLNCEPRDQALGRGSPWSRGPV